MFYRAVEGQPGKRQIKGCNGKIEVLGTGQQAVVHGLHPEGAALTWDCGRGPDTVKRDDLPAVSEVEIETFLGECTPLLATSRLPPASHCYPGGNLPDPAFAGSNTTLPKLAPIQGTNDLAAGIEAPNWFSELDSSEKNAVLEACLNKVDNRTDDPRDVWLRALFAARDAERLGCTDARELALEWSKRGASWTSEADFATAWDSCNPRPGRVTIGSLLAMGRDAGVVDLSPWRDPTLARLNVANFGTTPAVPAAAPAGRALSISQLPTTPPKRKWLHGTDLVRGAVSMLVAPGGRGKSSWLATMALACASNRPLLGAHVFCGPLRVLMINAEDPMGEIALRLRAAMQHHGLQDGDVPGLHVIGADRWGVQLLAPGKSGPMLNQAGWDQPTAELDRHEPDVLMIDPLISVMGGASPNDNAAAGLFMGQMVSLAAKRSMGVVVAHHGAKGRDPLSAESAKWERQAS
jgi:AAA domain/Primase C terminal 2 (PriCT-2)